MSDEISVEFAKVEDIPSLLHFMLDDFLRTNNLNTPNSVTRKDAYQAYSDLVVECVKSGTSIVLRNDMGEVVAMRLSTFSNRSDPEVPIIYDTAIQPIFDLLYTLTYKKWDLIPADVDRVLYVEILSVAEAYRGKGLAKILTSVGLEEAKDAGATGIMAESTSVASQMLFKKCGYETLRELQHSDFLGDNGQPVFAPLPDGATTAKFVFKRL